MPKGVYLRGPRTAKQKHDDYLKSIRMKGKTLYKITEETKKKISQALKGNIPVNRGVQRKDILKKVDRYKNGLENQCKIHGFHKKWSLHSENNVKCNLCAIEKQRLAAKKDPLKFIFRDARQHSKKTKRIFSITLQDLYTLKENQKNLCSLSGIEFSEEVKPSLDRIDSKKGYEKENLQLVTFEVNRMKSDFTMERFMYLCKKISEAELSKKKK